MVNFGEDNHRRLHEDDERRKLINKDTDEYKEYFKYFGYDNTELYMQPTEKRAIDLLPTSGYKGFKSSYSLNIRKA